MKTANTDLMQLIPLFMRSDEFVQATAQAVNDIMSHADPAKLRTWDQLDKLTHEELDELAWELNVLWYNAAGTLEQKREQIRTSDNAWRTLGTVYAVEMVISQLFGSGKLEEFWEYEDGRPHHFRISLSDPSVLTPAGEKEFRRVLELVKRKSQILDTIRLVMEQKFNAFIAVVPHDITRENHTIIVNLDNEFIGPNVYTGMAVMDSTKERHTWPS
jgi:phage tail P2-like protein|nr:MAG TPA: tail protein [Caudoviricetes sp.]